MKKLCLVLAIVWALAGLQAWLPYPLAKHQLSFSGAPATKEQLGEMLFFDPILSADRTLSCASCHQPAHGFADTLAFSLGVGGRKGRRNAQSCLNLAERPHFFYDGRAATLEAQVKFPIEDHNEMALPADSAVGRLNNSKKYLAHFMRLYGEKPTLNNIEHAIASFERTLETSNSPFDKYMDGDSTAISASAARGRLLFMSPKAKCFDCHFSPDFTGDEFRNIGLFDGLHLNDSGRYEVTHLAADIGKFKVPGLRNVAVTAPYMHNGMFKTLKEVITYYNDPYAVVPHPKNMDTLLLQPLHLNTQEQTDLENFLISLTDKRFPLP
jgi:cytochrome c peroxidase